MCGLASLANLDKVFFMPCLEMNSEKSSAIDLGDVSLTHWYILWGFTVKLIFKKIQKTNKSSALSMQE